MAERLYNFAAGPAVLPVEVLDIVRENIINYQDSGLGIMEMSHRSPQFEDIVFTAEKNLRLLLGISDDYAVLFCTGGARMQFSMVPMNLLRPGTVADYLITGFWAEYAWKEAQRFGAAHIACSSKEENFHSIPQSLQLSENCAYVHFTSNNTIVGTEYRSEPEVGDRLLICDASSDICSRPLDVSKYALIYAGAQKNLGPAGVTVVIIRKDLLAGIPDGLPTMLDYRTYAEHKSLFNTPPTFNIYVLGEVLKWIVHHGGLEAMENRNREKAMLLYDYLDSSEFYEGSVARNSRSMMNVTFRAKDRDHESTFIKEAAAAGFLELKGHRVLGGMRASIYNAFPKEGILALITFMKEFAAHHG